MPMRSRYAEKTALVSCSSCFPSCTPHRALVGGLAVVATRGGALGAYSGFSGTRPWTAITWPNHSGPRMPNLASPEGLQIPATSLTLILARQYPAPDNLRRRLRAGVGSGWRRQVCATSER